MKKIFILVLLFTSSIIAHTTNIIYQNYIQVYGEGPVGKYILGFDTKDYTEKDAVKYAQKEILEFLSGMIYGYKFVYKVHNKMNKSEGYFELTPLASFKKDDRNLTLTQLQEAKDKIRIQAQYRLTADQKTYLLGYNASSARMSMGEATGSWIADWSKRLELYKKAIENAVLNGAKKQYKARPLYITGRLLLDESPIFAMIHADWRVIVKINLIISTVSYQQSY